MGGRRERIALDTELFQSLLSREGAFSSIVDSLVQEKFSKAVLSFGTGLQLQKRQNGHFLVELQFRIEMLSSSSDRLGRFLLW